MRTGTAQPPSLNAAQRRRDLDHLSEHEVDLLVVGGGVTGCGVALDAASRGMKVALVERRDLASGTSRWSSKLVHGGLRYLAKGDVGLARESAVERGILMGRTAPHLTRTLPMVVPAVAGLSRGQSAFVSAGHALAHLLGAGTASHLPRPRHLDAPTTRAMIPALDPTGLRGGWVNYDGQLEDDARLVVALARTAAEHGARVITYATADCVDGEGADVTVDGERLRIKAKCVINAAGVWAGDLDPDVRLRPSKGAHVVVRSAALGHPAASMTVAVPGEPNRWVFALPHPDGLVHIGLTDDPVEQREDEPHADDHDVEFLLRTLNAALAVPLTRTDVVGSYAGYRPLLTGTEGRTADLSRRHAVIRSSTGAISVVGGKLTTYRRMAQDAVDATNLAIGCCRTHDLPLVGAARVPVPQGVPARLVRRYGSEAAQVAACGPTTPVADGVPVLRCELDWAVAHEGARTVDDLLARRTRLTFVDDWAEAARPAAEEVLAASRA